MKLKLEIDLDWIDEESNLDETVKQSVINSVSNKIKKGIEEKIEKDLNNKINENVVSVINQKTEELFDNFMNREIYLSDNYGSKVKVYPNVTALIKERFDNFMLQNVDDKGITTDSSYGAKHKRIYYIIDKQLKDFADKFTKDAVTQVSAEIKDNIKNGLTEKLGAELMKVLKIDNMLKLNS